MEDAMEFLASKCCALDLWQGTRVQFSLETQASTTVSLTSKTAPQQLTLQLLSQGLTLLELGYLSLSSRRGSQRGVHDKKE